MAALYGTEDDALLAWQRACAQVAETLRGPHEEERLRKALQLAQDGHVTLEDDGFAMVESRGKRYEVQADGTCACPDAQHRGVTCKHTLAVQIHALAAAALCPDGTPPLAPAATPSPATEAPRPRGWQPTPPTSARWAVHEAPTSACFKFRVGGVELLYTLRGVDDAELVRRITTTLPTLHAVMDACAARVAQRDAAPEAVPAAPPVPTPAAARVSGLLRPWQATKAALRAGPPTCHQPRPHASGETEAVRQASGADTSGAASEQARSRPRSAERSEGRLDRTRARRG
jgi:hypothetical protein